MGQISYIHLLVNVFSHLIQVLYVVQRRIMFDEYLDPVQYPKHVFDIDQLHREDVVMKEKLVHLVDIH